MLKLLKASLKKYFSNYSGLPKECWQRIFMTFIDTLSGGVAFFISLYFVNDLHFSIQSSGFIISFYGLGTILGGLIGGKLSDRISPGIITTLSFFIKALAFVALIKFKAIFALIIILFIIGFTTYSFTAANNMWVMKHCQDYEEVRLKAFNIIYAAANLGFALSAFIMAALIPYGFYYIFFLSAVLLFVASLFLAYWEKNDVAIIKNMSSLSKEAVAVSEVASSVINKKIIMLVFVCLFVVGLIMAQLGATYPFYVTHAFPSLGVKAVSIFAMTNSLMIVALQTPIVNFFNRYNKMLLLGSGAFLMGFGMTILNFSTFFFLAIISCLIYTLGEMLFFSNAQLVCYQNGAEKKKGQSLGSFQAVYAMSVFLGPSIGGFIYHHFDGATLWYCCGIVGVLCLMACFYNKDSVVASS